MDAVPILITDAHGTITKANAPARALLGDCEGQPCAEVVNVKDGCGRGCSARCAAMLHEGAPSTGATGNVAGSPHRVVCTALGDEVVVFVEPLTDHGVKLDALSPRETEVLAHVAKGLTNNQIAAELGITFATVRTHLEHVREKLHASTRAEAVAKASALGLLDR